MTKKNQNLKYYSVLTILLGIFEDGSIGNIINFMAFFCGQIFVGLGLIYFYQHQTISPPFILNGVITGIGLILVSIKNPI